MSNRINKCYNIVCKKNFCWSRKSVGNHVFIRAASNKAALKNPDDYERKHKKRDRLTVLKALSSTVELTPNRPDYQFYEDPFLNPRSILKKKELLLAIDSGEKAADYVLQKYPELFPLRKPVPAWPEISTLSNLDETPENLLLLLKSKENTAKSVSLYEKLKVTEELSIDIHNAMLDYACFHALKSNPSEPNPEVDSETSSSSSSSSSDEEQDVIESKSKQSSWVISGYADQLFDELKRERNDPKTYEIYMLGLLKHGENIQAFNMLEEFHGKGFSGSIFLYNSFLRNVANLRDGDTNQWDMVQQITSHMKKNKIQPNVVTFIEILDIASGMKKDPLVLCRKLLKEMKKCKIVPSLGCYFYVLEAERKKAYPNINVLWELINILKDGNIDYTLHHPSDLLFFHTAMDLARIKSHRVTAKELLQIVLDNDLHYILGGKTNSFFGNYLCAIARRSETIDDVMEEYERIVPKYLIPRDWVFEQLLKACKSHKKPDYVLRLYTDMVSMRVRLTDRTAAALFQALDEKIPKERAEEFLRVALDSKKWMKFFQVRMTSDISSTIIKLLCLCEKCDEAREMLDDLARKNIKPSQSAMVSLLELSLHQGNKKTAMNLLKKMSEMDFNLTKVLEKEIIDSPLISEERDKILSWFTKES